MPISLATERDPFRGPAPKRDTAQLRDHHTLRVPQARVLSAMIPTYDDDPSWDWPLVTRAKLAVRAGYTAISGTVTRALNGIRNTNQTSGDPHLGLIDLGMVELVKVEIEVGFTETNYRITEVGLAAYRAYIAAGNKLPEVKDADTCTNDRYRE